MTFALTNVASAQRFAKPFIKYVGGKWQLMPQLLPHIPKKFGRYFEPFVGGGALFWGLAPAAATISDTSEALIRTYRAVQNSVEDVIARLQKFRYDRDLFYEVRGLGFDCSTDVEVAARFVFLNKTCYNGLFRVNRRGQFNVPFGRHQNPTICDCDTLRACSQALAKVNILVADFEVAVEGARRGDLVYFDPPYIPLSVTSSFDAYTCDGFGIEDHQRLRVVARSLKQRGVHVILSNSSSPLARSLYKDGFHVSSVPAKRSINSQAEKRGAIAELIIE